MDGIPIGRTQKEKQLSSKNLEAGKIACFFLFALIKF
jgi:hypothetical protein